MGIRVIKIDNDTDFEKAKKIRYEVFVIEQKVPEADEFDEYEPVCHHFLALDGEKAVGAARWRRTENGVKLERFAVAASHRGKGVGSALVEAVLQDIDKNNEAKDALKYLHAQLDAIPLYAKFGFEAKGEVFDECNILHRTMELPA